MRPPPRWFRRILRLLPSRFRRSHGDAILDLAQEYAQERSTLGRALVWTRAALDVVAVAILGRLGHGASAATIGPVATRRSPHLETWIQDVRFGFRSLQRDAGFAAFALLIAGLGVGASVTVFSVAQALLVRPLPFHDPDRLVWISNGDWERGQHLSEISVQVAYLVELRNRAEQLDDVAGYHLFDADGDHALVESGEPRRVTRLRVTENFFTVLGVEPALGRTFSPEEAWDDGPRAVLLTHRFWAARFASDPGLVGRTVTIDGVPTSVIGVLPPSFDFGSIFAPGRRIDYVAPFPLSERSNRTGNTLALIGRLARGATPASAQSEAAALAATLTQGRLNGFDPIARPLREHVSGAFRPAVLVLMGAVGLVMLIVCANLSNLLLARGAVREREMAIRAAMGAPRRRLVRQMLVEALLLSGGGSACGLALAHLATGVIARLDVRIPLLGDARVDGAALTVALMTALATGIVFGVAPAIRITDPRLQEALKDSARGSSQSPRKGTLRSLLVLSEIALASLLLAVSSLMVRSFLHLLDVDLGYRAEHAIAVRIDPAARFASNAERVTFYSEILDEARTVPGVAAAGLSDILPMGFNRTWNLRAIDRPEAETVYPYVRVVSDGYVAAMGLSLVAGRDFGPEDGPDARRVALINEKTARTLWPSEGPLGRTVRSSGRDYAVVGVVRDTRQLSVDQAPGMEVFFPIRQLGDHSAVHLILRGDRSLEELTDAARARIRTVHPGLPLDEVVPIQGVVDASLAPRRFLVTLISGFATFALILASLGIYGVISYSVTQRRREIGIHMALGASAEAVRRRIVKDTLVLTALGLPVGLVGALLAGRFLRSLLFGVTPLDPVTYAAVVVLLGGVSVAAGYVPARRAATANPADVLSGDTPGSAT